jgi:hypothetical protein
LQLFDSKIENPVVFWQTISNSLLDFNELNPVALIQSLLDDLTENWTLRLARILHNLSAYIQHIPLDLYLSNWSTVVGQFESFFRRYYTQVSNNFFVLIFFVILVELREQCKQQRSKTNNH